MCCRNVVCFSGNSCGIRNEAFHMNIRNVTSTQACREEKKAKAKQKDPSDEF